MRTPIAPALIALLLASTPGARGAAVTAPHGHAAPPAHAAPESHAKPAHAAPLPVDSLQVDDQKWFKIYAADFTSLALAHREIEFAADQFRRVIGDYPPKQTYAVLGALDDPSRVDHAALREAGVDQIVDDWPPAGGGPTSPPAGAAPDPGRSLAERVAMWGLAAYAHDNSKGAPPAGRARLVPDWFESSIAGLSTPIVEQNRRLAWMHDHVDERLPFARLFSDKGRPAAAPGAKPGASRSAAARSPAASGAGKSAAAKRAGTAAADSAAARRMFDVESFTFARFIIEREGDRIMGFVLESLLAGNRELLAFNSFTTMLPRADALESEWVKWIKDRRNPGDRTAPR